MKKIAIAIALSAFIAAPAVAATERVSKGYIGIAAGKNTIATDTSTSSATWQASTATSIFGGYSFNPYVAAEAAYTNLGTAATDPVSVEATGSVMSLSAVGTLPLGKVFSLFGRVGYAQSKIEIAASSFSETNSGAIYGVGGQFNVGQRVGIRVAYDKFKVGSTTPADSALVSVGALVKF